MCPLAAFSICFLFINTPKKTEVPSSGVGDGKNAFYTYTPILSSIFLSLWGFTSSSFLALSLHYSLHDDMWKLITDNLATCSMAVFMGHEDLEKKNL